MRPPSKRLRAITAARTLPDDLVLEIVSRADAATIVRSAACSKPLRRDIHSPEFIRRVRRQHPGGGATCLLGFLHCAYDGAPRPRELFSLLHPTTPAAASLSEKRVAPLLSGGAAADLLGRYVPVTSRRGLQLLRCRHIYRHGRTDLCVFDPFTGDRAFFPSPPDLKDDSINNVLVTAADGVGSCFLLLAVKLGVLGTARSVVIQSQTVSSTSADRKWGPVTTATHPLPPQSSPNLYLYPRGRAVVLGTLIHWLMHNSDRNGCSLILTYRVDGTAAGLIELPDSGLLSRFESFNRHLTSSPDGRLRLLVSDKSTVSIWLLLSTDGAGWERQAVIDLSPLVRKLIKQWPERDVPVGFEGAGGRSGAVLLRPFMRNNGDASHSNGEDEGGAMDYQDE